MRCPSCGEANPERAKFCLECGTPLAAAESRESRRTVTVVFADMVGFTTLGESLDQESLRRVMDRFYAEMRGAIEAEQGTLAKFIGDAVLAVWGTPEVREDDALRAVRAADGMRRALAGLNEDLQTRWGVRVGMRTGVNTGEVVVDPARPADLLVGDTLNVAARLEQAASDGEVLVGPDTYRLVRGDVVLEPVEPLALKGKSKPLPAWRLVDASRPDRRTEDRLQAPLVGRDAEIAALRAAFDDAVGSRACRLITVIGSPGLGKTRLVSEFARSVRDEAVVLHGRCQATGEGITFQPVAEVLRGAAGIEDDDGPEAARDKLGRLLPEGEPGHDRIIEQAASLLGLAPAATAEETFWAVRRILEALARDRPVVLVHDDIHWGQPTFLDLLEHFAEWIRDAPVLVVALARPELREVRPGLAEGALALDPLGPDASEAMIAGLLGDADLPEGLAQRILETTGGNPLFLGETLRMLADEGVLRRQDGSWIAQAGDVAVPPTIHALLSARIERLAAEERSVVERAAVIGHSFYRGAVAELAPPPVRLVVDEALATLSRKELVRPEDEWWLDEQVFRFHHVLIRDAAYRSLLKEARAELHERFADWLERKAGDLAGEHEEVIAFHLEQAHAYRLELGPLDDAGQALAARAGRRLHSAGRRALTREDLPAAANLLRRALATLEEDAGRLEVLVDLAETLLSAGDTAAAEAIVEELGLGAEGDERLLARAVVFASQLDNLTGAGQVRETAEAAAAAAETLARLGDRAGEAKAHQVVAQSEALLGQVAAAEAALDRALVAARAADDRRRITAVLSGAPRAALWGPAPIVRASGRCLDVVRILRMTPGNRHVEAAALRSQAVLEAMRGRAEAARGILDTCRTTLEELGLALELHETGVHAGIVELLAGDPAAAERHLRAAQDGFRGLGVESGAAQAAALLARALVAQDRDEEALAATRFAEEHGGEDLKTTAAWLGARAEVLARAGEHDEARALARRAVELTEPTDALADRADALMALAAVEGEAGDADAAQRARDRARELYAAKDHSVGVELAGGGPAAPEAESPATATATPAPQSPSAARWQRYLELHGRHEVEAIRELYAEDFRLVDTRQLGWSEWDRDQFMAHNLSVAALDPGYRVTSETLLDEGCLHVNVLAFHTVVEGSEMENGLGIVEIGGERALYCEIFEPEDREGMLARAAELRPLAATAATGRSPEITYARWTDAYNRRNWDALRALMTPDIRITDHRVIGWEPIEDVEAMLELQTSSVEMVPEMRSAVTAVLHRDEESIAVTMRFFDASMAVEFLSLNTFDERGRIASGDIHEPGDEDALRAFRRGSPVHELGATLAGRAQLAFADAYERRDWDAIAALAAEDLVVVDHRQGAEVGLLDLVRAAVETGPDLRFAIERVVASAERVVAHTSVTTSAGAELRLGHVAAVHEDGRLKHVELLEDPTDAALLEAFRRVRIGDTEAGRVHVVFLERFNARDWERLLELHAEGFEQIDRRPVGWEPQSAQASIDQMRGWVGMAPDAHMELARVDHLDEHVLAGLVLGRGTTADGVAVELPFHHVTEVRDGRIARIEYFDPDDADGVRRTFERWAARETHQLEEGLADQRASEEPLTARLVREWAEVFNARDWEGMARQQGEGYVSEDRRPLSGGETRGSDEAMELARAIVDVSPDATWRFETVDAGDRVGLFRSLVDGHTPDGGPLSVHMLQVVVAGPDRLTQRVVAYDETQEDEAWAQYRALLDDGDAQWWEAHERNGRALEAALNARDFERLRELLTEDFTQADRRPVGSQPPVDRDGFVGLIRSGNEAAPDSRAKFEVLHVDGLHRVARMTYSGTTQGGGGAWEIVLYTAARITADGRLQYSDLHESEEAALRAMRELAGAQDEAWRWHQAAVAHWAEAINTRDFDELRALLHPDFVQEDRRRGALAPESQQVFLDSLHDIVEAVPDIVVELELLAARPDRRVARYRWNGHFGQSGGEMEIEFFVLSAVRDGLTCRTVIFDTEAEALAELDKPDVHPRDESLDELADHADEPAPHDPLYEALISAFNARDWDAYGACFEEDFVWLDHRSGVRSEVRGRAQMVATMREMADRNDVRWEYEHIVPDGRVRISRTRHVGTYRGGPYETPKIDVGWRSARGLFQGCETFDDDKLDEARARAAEIERELAGTPVARAYDDLVAAFNARDWERVADLNHPGFVLEDHRPLLRAEPLDHDAMVANFAQTAGEGDLRWSVVRRVVAGERSEIALARWSGTARGAPFEVEFLDVHGLAEDGRLLWSHTFATEQEDEARALLAELAGAGPARQASANPADWWEDFNARWVRAAMAGDWQALGDTFADDVQVVSHQPGLRHELRGRAASTEQWHQVATIGGVVAVATLDVRGPRLALRRVQVTAPPEAQAEFHYEALHVVALDDDGRTARVDLYDPEQEDEARARLEELAVGGGDDVPAVVGAYARFRAAFDARDWDAFAAELHPVFRLADHRPGIRNEIVGREAMVENMRGAAAGSDVRWDAETVAVSGSAHLAAAHWHGTLRGAPFEVRYLDFHAVDREGRLVCNDSFAPEQETEARAQLAAWERHEAGVRAGERAWRERDLDALRAQLTDDYECVDRRPGASLDMPGPDRMLQTAREIFELTPDVEHVQTLHAVAGDVRVVHSRWRGSFAEGGGPMEIEFFTVARTRDGRQQFAELHPDAEAAYAAFDALAQAGPAAPRPAVDAYFAAGQALTDRDLDRFDELVGAPFRFADHRPGLQTEAEGEDFVAMIHQMMETAPIVWSATTIEARGAAVLARVTHTGVYEGGPWEIAYLGVSSVAPDGRMATLDIFGEEQEAEARARYEELAGADS